MNITYARMSQSYLNINTSQNKPIQPQAMTKNTYANSRSSNRLGFKGYLGYTVINDPKSKTENKVIHETYFFRDSKTLNFVSDYVNKTFPKGTHIAEYGCSNGEEAYSLAMLLNASNNDKRYKITGYDVSEDIVNQAKGGIHHIGGFDAFDHFLDQPETVIMEENIPLRRLFYNHFEKVESKDGKPYFKLKDKVFDGVVDFKYGDIRDINTPKSPLPENTGVVVFKNAWYHLQKLGMGTVEDVVEKIHTVLPKDGLLVVGSLSTDHMLNSEEPNSKIIGPDGLKINIRTGSAFQKILEDKGFVPVCYDVPSTYHPSVIKYMSNVLSLPSVWKKIK